MNYQSTSALIDSWTDVSIHDSVQRTALKTTGSAKILIVHQDISVAHLIKLELEHDRHQVNLAYDGITGFSYVREQGPDLIIIDWSIPRLSAVEFCQYVRSYSYLTPIVVLTNENQPGDRIQSLNAGADDCLSKPFLFEELRAKVRAHLRRTAREDTAVLKFANLILDCDTREIRRGSDIIHLTAREFDLLEYFMRHPNQVVTRTQILETVWGNDYEGKSNIVEVYIRNLRIKLESDTPTRFLKTIRGVGYVLRT